MRKAVILVLFAWLLVATGSAGAAARRRHKKKPVPALCTPTTTPYKSRSTYRRTLAANPLAQVYSLWGSPPTPTVGVVGFERPVYGCVYGHRGAVGLGSEPWEDSGKYMNLNQSGDLNVVLGGRSWRSRTTPWAR